jgi:hypothetical protein
MSVRESDRSLRGVWIDKRQRQDILTSHQEALVPVNITRGSSDPDESQNPWAVSPETAELASAFNPKLLPSIQ